MKKSKAIKTKKRILFLILFMIFLVIIMSIIIAVINSKNQEVSSREDYTLEEDSSYLKERIIPRNIALLDSYKGNVRRDNLYTKLQSVVNFIVDFNNDKMLIDEYYKQNEENIKLLFGDISLEKFKFINSKINLNNANNFEYAEILEGSNNVLENAASFEICLNFKNKEKVNLKVYIRNEATSIEKDIIFEII